MMNQTYYFRLLKIDELRPQETTSLLTFKEASDDCLEDDHYITGST